MKLGERILRTVKVVRTAAILYALYKGPALARRFLRRPRRTEIELHATHERAAVHILALALDLRGVMIKMCQAIATRADVFPPEFIDRLKQCHDAVPPHSFEAVRAVIEAELGKPLDAVFTEFDREPIAAASRPASASKVEGRSTAERWRESRPGSMPGPASTRGMRTSSSYSEFWCAQVACS